MPRVRVVPDTNVLIDALISKGTPPDNKDNAILTSAIAGKADLIVSGDKKHVIALGEVEGIPVVTAREALERLGDS